MFNRLDPNQARRFVGPDLDPNCLQKLSADDTSRPWVNAQTIQDTCSVHMYINAAIKYLNK